MLRLLILCTAAAAALVPFSWAADAKAGQASYDKACKSCHGADGTANAAVAKAMGVEMQDLRSAGVQKLSNDDIKKIVAEGKGKMRPIKTVSGAALDDLAAYVHSLKK